MTTTTAAPDEIGFDELRAELVSHPLYARIDTLDRLRTFARSHVFAVWDFMSLLKRLQRELTCVAHPWQPPSDGVLARFVNEIVVAEESDEDGFGGHASHFDLYLGAMREIGADTGPIDGFLAALASGQAPIEALEQCDVPESTRAFVRGNLRLAEHGALHEVAAAFCHGREDVIPDMFERMIDTLRRSGQQCDRLVHYLDRHVELDGDEHGPLALRLVASTCDGNPIRVEQANRAAMEAIGARIRLWEGIVAEFDREELR